MKKLIFTIIPVLLLLFIHYSCNKCKTESEGPYYLTDVDLNMVPYIGNETLVYKNIAGDSIKFVADKRYSRMDQSASFPEGETECADAVWQYQWNFSTFKNSDNAEMWVGLCNNRNRHDFGIWLEFHSPIEFWYNDYINFDSGKFYCSNNLISPVDSLVIGNKKFYSVYEIYYNNCSSPALPIIYYTINNGLVGFKTVGSVDWYLE